MSEPGSKNSKARRPRMTKLRIVATPRSVTNGEVQKSERNALALRGQQQRCDRAEQRDQLDVLISELIRNHRLAHVRRHVRVPRADEGSNDGEVQSQEDSGYLS